MVLSLAPTMAFAATNGKCGDDVSWSLNGATLTISGTGEMEDYSGSSSVPWSSQRSTIKTIIIKSGVTSIGNYAFYHCNNLTDVTIPTSVESIGQYSFSNCLSLIRLKLPVSLRKIDKFAFSSCVSLTELALPAMVTSIDRWAFQGCTSLANVTLPAGATKIGVDAFDGTPWLTVLCNGNNGLGIADGWLLAYSGTAKEVIVPTSVKNIGDGAFQDCDSLTGVTIPTSVKSIGTYAFGYCDNLTSVSIPDNLTKIDDCVFDSCKSLKSVTIPNSAKSIGAYAFYGCSSLENVTIPKSVKSIGKCAFDSCSSLKSVTFKGNAPEMEKDCFYDVTATASYPKGDSTWTKDARKDYGGTITWKAYGDAAPSLSATTASLYVGKTKTLTVKDKPEGATVKWSSSDKSVAKVSSSGKITAVKKGTATITAAVTSGGKTTKLKCKVTVKNPTVKLSATTASLYLGKTKTLKATVTGSSNTVKWTSSDKTIATVSSSGKITAKKAGTATITGYITVNDTKYKATCKVTVKKPSVKLDKTKLSLTVGKSATLTATTAPSGQTVKWSSSDKSVATVSKGKVTAKKKGTATITASFQYNDKTYKKTCKVTVVKK